MNKNSKEAEFPLKQEVPHNSNDQHEKEKASPSSSSLASSSSQWPRLKDPRIVRVSRAFGGKDRHSKVCTIRGLRDRRVRLSVPTAIQLYDLQDRLGLNQPSKVVDWLLNAAKQEIDQLPPLPNFPPIGTNFNFGFPSSNETSTNTSHLHQQLLNFNRNNNIHWEGSTSSQNSSWKLNPKEVSREMVSEKPNYWMNRSTQEEENNKQGSNIEGTSPSAIVLQNNNNLLQRPNHPSFLGLLNTMPLGTNYNWGGASSNDVVNSSQLGGNIGLITNQHDGNAITSLPPMLSLSTGNSSQMLLGTSQSYFSSNVNAMEMDHHHQHQREINSLHYHQMLSSSNSQNPLNNSLNNPSFSLAMMSTPKFLQSSRENTSNKEQDFNPK
ncbi:unnamed protein product [Trifolium pratense]|uniref:Uncharacterized protein n=1 Tax=Trifolium pratense TaxID=57577 RepID=A0ACB0LI59_TRIPR|nr:unnamed protein product [Trifolium pratense]